jgi:2-haloacid dehalogenase
VTLSGREGVTKPDPEIYRRLFNTYGIDPLAALFVDDSAVNVEAARVLGMDAVLFTEPDELRHELTARGLLG